MALVSNILADKVEVEAIVDGHEFLDWVSMSFSAQINRPRTLTLEAAGKEAVEKCRLGGLITVETGRGNQIGNLAFKGIIKVVRPRPDSVTVVAFDYLTHLQSSPAVEYTQSDISGHDLYYLAAAAANYKGIDVSGLLEGSGIIATDDMALTGLMSRKAFIDKCFNSLYKIFIDGDHEKFTAIPWRYAIRQNERLDFWFSDHLHRQAQPVLTISEEDDNIGEGGIAAQIDSTKIVNNATFVSSTNSDMFVTYTDEHSEEVFGPSGFITQINTANPDRLEVLAREYVNLYSQPTISYDVQLVNAEWVALGDLVRITAPHLKRNDILPVAAYTIDITDAITTTLTLGVPPLTLGELVKRLS